MEMNGHSARMVKRYAACCIAGMLLTFLVGAQGLMKYYVRENSMYIELRKDAPKSFLDSFIVQFDLKDLNLTALMQRGETEALKKEGWQVVVNNPKLYLLEKKMEALRGSTNMSDRFLFIDRPEIRFPARNNGVLLGINRFKRKEPFRLQHSFVTFFLRGSQQTREVRLAGSFTNWQADSRLMTRTDSGWILPVKLDAGKYWYKFIVDGRWVTDDDNELHENDGLGNVNSVYFRPNHSFFLPGNAGRKNVYLVGSFNGWRPGEMRMTFTGDGWRLAAYLGEGTHTYKYWVDGAWVQDPTNKTTLPDGHGGANSVITLGPPHLFFLPGHQSATRVILTGSFNDWRKDELFMHRSATGWELPYILGPGNYTYTFLVDGRETIGNGATLLPSKPSQALLIIQPNHGFYLKGFSDAHSVQLAGDFTAWQSQPFPLKRTAEGWILAVHLTAGKHLYKFIVDGKWITDPGNKLWEQNEFGTGNSVIWVEEQTHPLQDAIPAKSEHKE
jgi:Glycogen recognition site of AMP-activated protein kinase